MEGSNRRNVLLGGAALLLFIVAAALYFSRARAEAEFPQEYTIDGVCLACQQEAQLTASMRQRQPLECPSCSERAVYLWLQCFECNKRFVPNLERSANGSPPRLPIAPACPVCGSSDVGQYVADDQGQQPIGDAPLPEWPIK